jgi:hypothetical protein
MDVSDEVHSLATMPSWKQLLAPTKLEAKDLVWTFWTRGKSLALQGIKLLLLSFEVQHPRCVSNHSVENE